MKLRVYEFEGTVEEILKAQQRMADLGHKTSLAEDDKTSELPKISTKNEDEDDQFVTEKVARAALRRRPLSEAQIKVLKTLYKKHLSWTSSSELQKATGYSRSQFSGLMGAFGRRVSYTKGYREGSSLFDWRWDSAKECYNYRLPQTVRDAMDSLGLA